ncbi:MAG: hypothetical protein QOJ25_579 [Solirubrobacteraceae bacterium]|jgi:uncharacterized protein with FMN-binding domain|nr:hypothetical protein [Solirubrobacteraceae bacterium]
MRGRFVSRTLPILLGTTAVTVPVWAGAAAGATVKTYYGPPVHMQYGPVQVGIKVSGSRMTLVFGHGPTDRPRSKQIQARALPILEREALQAQSVRGIHKVSGASLTTFAFEASLAKAMATAHLRGA